MLEFSLSHHDIIRMGIISTLFISIFVTAELIRFTLKPRVEITRKFVHFSGGMVTLSFSYVFESHWAVLIMCIAFVSILYGSKKLNLLNSVHGIDRPSSGGIFFPIAVYTTWVFAMYNHQPHFYLIGMLILSISDSMAALVGTSYGRFLFLIEKERKSIEGTIIFFLLTFLITEQVLLHLTAIGPAKSTLTGIYVALLVTGFELLSLKGSDNLFIPIGTVYILIRFPNNPLNEMLFQISLLLIIIIAFILIGKITKVFGVSGLVGIGLMAYGAWALVEYPWFIPVATAFILVNFAPWFKPQTTQSNREFRIRTVFYLVAIMFMWILIVNLLLDFQAQLIVPYLFSFVSVMDLLWRRQIRTTSQDKSVTTFFENPPQWIRLIILFLIFYPVQLFFYPDLNLTVAFFTVVPMAYFYFWLTEKVYAKINESYVSIDAMRYNLLISCLVSSVVMMIYFSISEYLLA